jgi:hypothetical protein
MKTTTDFIGYYKFVRLSSLDENDFASLGLDKKELVEKLHLSGEARTMITLPIYEEELIHERVEFVSYLGLLTIQVNKKDRSYRIVSVPEFLETSIGREAATEIRREWNI